MATRRTTGAKTKTMDSRNTLGGFTIIEVVLVLAIAGLIFMMVFIALPQLQRAQRDTQRRQDLGRLEAAISQYQTNNNGRIPNEDALKGACTDVDSCSSFVKNYIVGVNGNPLEDFTDPLGAPYTFEYHANSTGASAPTWDGGRVVHFYASSRCGDEEGTVVDGSGARNYAVMYKLEGSGVYCQDNAG